MCLSARCVLVCCSTAGSSVALGWYCFAHTFARSHRVQWAPCVLCCTICTLCAVPHCPRLCSEVHCVCIAALHFWAVDMGTWNFCYALSHRRGPWDVQLLQCTASLPGGSGQGNACNALPHCLRAVGTGAPTLHRHTVRGQWVVELLSCTATLLGDSGQCNSCNAVPHCLGAWGSGSPATHVPHCPGAVRSATLAIHRLTV